MDSLPPPPPASTGPLPPPSPLVPAAWGAPTETMRPRPPAHRWWEKTLAILGLVFLFPILLTIPFWGQLKQYRRWKQGERDRLTGLMVWGAIASIWLLGTIAFAPPESTQAQVVAASSTSQVELIPDQVPGASTARESRLVRVVNAMLASPEMPPLSEFCDAYDVTGYELAWQSYNEGSGPGLLLGFTNREVFDELVGRC